MDEQIWETLSHVADPEMKEVSVVDLGMIEKVDVQGSRVVVCALPTFMGCPALEIIERDITKAISSLTGVDAVSVKFLRDPAWTTNRITDKGREALKRMGIAPPPVFEEEAGMWQVNCPYCESPFTTMENLFGPTACRSILYCKACRNPFEAMKPVSTL
ncbi:1,2-phenylacetyl-CoA epoxidase subunit PaaD [Bacillus fonticola]|uniref:1,2-phenylacetyl-CoA epoxidase subunit PaaD n=1 Tax=Bacillus fonticola TaxID=2728853 RepID=UPI001D154368|nr:1,2-phenylacetyl-CoA epoxidase subunit PaaD [Bacillus fonticola]